MPMEFEAVGSSRQILLLLELEFHSEKKTAQKLTIFTTKKWLLQQRKLDVPHQRLLAGPGIPRPTGRAPCPAARAPYPAAGTNDNDPFFDLS